MTGFHRTAEWGRLVRQMKPIIESQVAAGTAVCIDCGRPVLPGDRWQVGHRLPHATHPHLSAQTWNLGPSHTGRCNQRAGAILGNKLRSKGKSRREGMVKW